MKNKRESYYKKYIKYKSKYLQLKNQTGGDNSFIKGTINKYRKQFGEEKVNKEFDRIFNLPDTVPEEEFDKQLFKAIYHFELQVPRRKPPLTIIKKGTDLWHASIHDFKYTNSKVNFFAGSMSDLVKHIVPYIQHTTKASSIYLYHYQTKYDNYFINLTADYGIVDLEWYITSLDKSYQPNFGMNGIGDNLIPANWLVSNRAKYDALKNTRGWYEHKEALLVSQMDEIMVYGPRVDDYLVLVEKKIYKMEKRRKRKFEI